MRGDPRSAALEPAEAEAAEEQEPALPLAQVIVKRRTLELARIDVVRRLDLAQAGAHREMLQRALSALDQELDRLI